MDVDEDVMPRHEDDDADADDDEGLRHRLLILLVGIALLPLTLTATLSTHLTYNLITHTHFINSFSGQPSAPLARWRYDILMREICLLAH